jgi:hypothetical protein
MKATLPLLAAAAMLFASEHAGAAGRANNFGEKGELMFSADRLVPVISYAHASSTDDQGLTHSRSASGLSLLWGRNLGLAEAGNVALNVHTIPRVAADYVVIQHLTLGGALAIGFGLGGTDEDQVRGGGVVTARKTDSPRATAIGFAPRVGYVIPLSELFAFWPRGGFGFYSVSQKQDTTDNNGVVSTTSVTDTIISLDLDPQFALVPVEHFFIHFGPLMNIPLSGSRSFKRTTGSQTTTVSNDISLFHFGITAGIGGWFDL